MANVIDTLFIELGIEDKNFNTQAKNAEKQFSNLEKSVIKTETAHKKATIQVKKADEQVRKLSAGLNVAFRAFATLTASIMGASGFSKLATDIAKTNIELENTSKNLGLTSQEFSKLNGAMELTGENASGMTGYMKSLSNDMNSFAMMGDSSILPYFNALGIGLLDSSGKVRDLDAVLLDLSDRLSTMDRKQAYTIAKHLGMDDSTANTLMRGRAEMQRLLDLQKDIYVSSEEEIENSRKLAEMQGLLSLQFKSLKTIIGNALTPVLIFLSEKLTGLIKFITKHKKETEAVFLGIASAITLFLIPALSTATGAVLAFLLPFTPLIAAVTALGGAFALLYDDYKTWANGGKSLFDWGAFTNYIKNTNLSVNNLGKAFIYLTTGYKDLSQATNSLIDWLKLKGFIDNNTVSVNSLITGFKNLTRELVENLIPHLKRLADMFLKLFSGDFKGALNIAKEIGSEAWQGVKYLAEDVRDRLTGTVDVATGHEVGDLQKAMPSKKGSLKSLIASGESRQKGKSNYDVGNVAVVRNGKTRYVFYQGTLQDKTIGEVMELQRQGRIFATGKYQVIPKTLRNAVNQMGLSKNQKYDAKTQEAIATHLMKQRRPIYNYITTGKNLNSALVAGAQEWSSLPMANGRSYYRNGIDKAAHSYNSYKATMQNARNAYLKAVKMGMSEKQAFDYAVSNNGNDDTINNANIATNNIKAGRQAVNANKNVNNNTNIVVNGGINVHTSANTINGNMADAGKAFSNRVNQYAVAQM